MIDRLHQQILGRQFRSAATNQESNNFCSLHRLHHYLTFQIETFNKGSLAGQYSFSISLSYYRTVFIQVLDPVKKQFHVLVRCQSLFHKAIILLLSMLLSKTRFRAVLSKGHFINSVFDNSRTYSCAVDCFMEVAAYVFLPQLSNLSVKNEFTSLIFNACSDYLNSRQNSSLIRQIRIPV